MTSPSASEATRFTANSPHAYSKQSPLRSSTSAASPQTTSASRAANPNASITHNNPQPNSDPPKFRTETAKEKVARLRAQRLAERTKQLSPWERTVVRSRAIADRVHRATIAGLVGFSVLIFGFGAVATVDMIVHNRRKRRAFYEEQRDIYGARMVSAIETEKAGIPLDEDQLVVLGREKAKAQEEERKRALGWSGRVMAALKAAVNTDPRKDERIPVPTEAEVLQRIGVSNEGILLATKGRTRPTERDKVEGLGAKVEDRREKLAQDNLHGGMLDKVADRAAQDVKEKTGGWLGWGSSK